MACEAALDAYDTALETVDAGELAKHLLSGEGSYD
jgi:hypothetical protein